MIVGITGHQDIPITALDFLKKHIEKFVKDNPEMIAISSLAKGADQLFADISLKANKKLYVIVPSENYDSTFENIKDLKKYNKLLNSASYIKILPNKYPDEKAFFSAGKKIVEMSDELIAIWDGKAAQGLGGTGDIVEFAKELNKKISVFWPKNLKRQTNAKVI